MRFVFDERAADDLVRIFTWIAQGSPQAAGAVIRKLLQRIGQLEVPELPRLGRPGRVPGTRELVERVYIIVYEVHEERGEVIVTAVLHEAQDRH